MPPSEIPSGLGMSKAIMHAAMAGFHPKAILCVVLGDVSSLDDVSMMEMLVVEEEEIEV